MIINTKEIDKLIRSKVPAQWISDETGLDGNNIARYRNGKSDLKNMNRNYLEGLQKFYNMHKDDKPKEKLKIIGIRKAVGFFNDWQGAARVYFDLSNTSVWTETYVGPNEWNYYKDPKITQIAQKAINRLDERDNKITMREIRELVDEALNKEAE